jgi:hypothetical protein
MDTALYSTAIHEAGHCIGFYLVGIESEYATIVPGDGLLGHVLTSADAPTRIAAALHPIATEDDLRRVIGKLAGYAAERAFGFPGPENLCGTQDYTTATTLVTARYGQPDTILQACEGMVDALFRAPSVRSCTTALAQLLLAHKRIEKDTISSVCAALITLPWYQRPAAPAPPRRPAAPPPPVASPRPVRPATARPVASQRVLPRQRRPTCCDRSTKFDAGILDILRCARHESIGQQLGVVAVLATTVLTPVLMVAGIVDWLFL